MAGNSLYTADLKGRTKLMNLNCAKKIVELSK